LQDTIEWKIFQILFIFPEEKELPPIGLQLLLY